MIYSNNVFTQKEIDGIAEQLDDDPSTKGPTARPVRWMFRDEANGIMFVHYAKWLDEVETEFYRLVGSVFTRYCEQEGITVKTVFSARITLLVQSNNRELVTPEIAYPDECNKFVYFATSTDTPCLVNGLPIVPKAGECLLLSPSETLILSRPHLDNFFAVFEVEFA